MIKKNLFYCILLILVFTKLNAQNGGLTGREEKARQLLGMNTSDYTVFANQLRAFNKNEQSIVTDKKLSREQKSQALSKLQTERKEYVKQNLSQEQRKKLADLDKDNSAANNSPYKKQKKELEERLKKKGYKVTN